MEGSVPLSYKYVQYTIGHAPYNYYDSVRDWIAQKLTVKNFVISEKRYNKNTGVVVLNAVGFKLTESHNNQLRPTTLVYNNQLRPTTLVYNNQLRPTTLVYNNQLRPTTLVYNNQLRPTTLVYNNQLRPTTLVYNNQLRPTTLVYNN